MSLAFIDCETTGTDPERHCVWEIGLITDSGEYSWVLDLSDEERGAAEPMALSIGNYYERSQAVYSEHRLKFERRFPPNVEINPREAMQTIKLITVMERPTLAGFLAKEISTSHLVGAVPSFDARFVGDLMRAHKWVPSWHYHLVDVEALTAGKLGLQPPWKSKDIYKQLGINPEYFDEHTALGDARMAKAVYELVFNLEPSYPGALIQETEEPTSEGKERAISAH